jgi:3-hydroxymyristoyl/3-hydroxydecanoyl-(acyl carrier protein) dehydratase
LSGGDPFLLLETGERHRFRVEIPAASPLFAGHFPGHPILPGIAHLAIVERALGVPLAAVRSLRLRRPVAPGEALELSLGSADGEGWTRFDIRQEGAPVGGGAVCTSPAAVGAEPEEEAALPAVGEFPVLLPHAPPARLIRGVLAVSAAGIVCVAEIPPDHPLAAAGRLLGVEAAAQAAAVLEALARRAETQDPAPRIGYLVGVREARFAAASLAAGRAFRVSARLQGSAPPLSVYEIAVGEPGREVATGTISTFLADPIRDGPTRDG